MTPAPSFVDSLLQSVSPNLILFLGQSLIVVIAILGTLAGLLAVISALGFRPRPQARLEAKSVNDEWIERKRSLESLFLSKKEWKAKVKEDQASEKERQESGNSKKRLWILDFAGDVEASRTDGLRNEITAILELAANGKSEDEVLLRLESPGGTVTGYGHAAAQLERLRKAGVKLTVAIDEVAASGGYMMAAVADRIVAGPFAVIGSIGVIGQLPNVHRLLKKYDVDYLEVTAGEHKRPVSVFGQLTDEGIQKFKSQIADTHTLFRDHVKQHRPELDINSVATGDVWHGVDGLKNGLVDELMTSDEFIYHARHKENRDVFHLRWRPALSLRDRLEESVSIGIANTVERIVSRIANRSLKV